MHGRPVIYIPAKYHNANDRDIDEMTKFIVYCLVSIKIFTYIFSASYFNIFHRKRHRKDVSKKLSIISA